MYCDNNTFANFTGFVDTEQEDLAQQACTEAENGCQQAANDGYTVPGCNVTCTSGTAFS